MREGKDDNTMHVLLQTRTMLILSVLMLISSNILDPPFSTFGGILNLLTLVVLVFVILRIRRSISELKSSTSNP